jgi:hypothetical protein
MGVPVSTATRQRRRGFGRHWIKQAEAFARSKSETTTQSIGVGWEESAATDSGHSILTPGEPNRQTGAEMATDATDLHPR